jgi:hypothetical protein
MLYGMSTYPAQHEFITKFMGPALYFRGWEPGRCCGIVFGTGRDLGYHSEEPEYYDEKLFEHIFDEATIHTIIGTLGHMQGKRLREMPLPEAYALGETIADVIFRAGYQDKRSLAYAIALTVRLGPHIWEERKVRKALAERPQKAPISEVLDEIGL